MKRSRLLPLIVLSLSLCSYAQLWSGVLDPTRAIDWTQIGAGTIPTNYVQVGSTIGAYSGNTDAINNALALCDGATGQYVLLGPGTFILSAGGTISNGIRISKNKCVLRGSGPTQTKVVFTVGAHDSCQGENSDICLNGPAISVPPVNVASVTGGLSQGSTSITISANTSGNTKLVVGQTLALDLGVDSTSRSGDTGNVFVCDASGGQCTQAGGGGDGRPARPEMQYVLVTNISGGSCPCTVGISPGLYMPNWATGNIPQAWWNSTQPFSTGQGIESMSIDGSQDAAASGGSLATIASVGASYGWVKNIISIKQHPEPVSLTNTQRHIRWFVSHHMTVRDSYFVGRAGYDDYGVNFYLSGDCLTENNIFEHLPSEMQNEQGFGNVFGYNFTVNNIWNVGGSWAQGAIYGHGGQENYFLSEGNIVFGQEFENYFGHGFFITSFRNRYFGFQNGNQSQTVPGFVYGLNRYFNFVGNVLGVNGYHTTYQTVGGGGTNNCVFSIYAVGLGNNCANGDGNNYPVDDTLVPATSLTTMLRWGNYDVVTKTNRFCGNSSDTGWSTTCGSKSEVPTAISMYSNKIPTTGDTGAGQPVLPASFYLNNQPAWWPSSKPWPNIGPDVTGGAVGVCSGGTFSGWPAVATQAVPSPCTGGVLAADGTNGRVISNPAMDCYFSLGGTPDGGGTGTATPLTNFDAIACYGDAPPPPAPPTNLSDVVK